MTKKFAFRKKWYFSKFVSVLNLQAPPTSCLKQLSSHLPVKKRLLWSHKQGWKGTTYIWLLLYQQSPNTKEKKTCCQERHVIQSRAWQPFRSICFFKAKLWTPLHHECQLETTTSSISSLFPVPSGCALSLENKALGSQTANRRAHPCEIFKELCSSQALGAAASHVYTSDRIIPTHQMCSDILTRCRWQREVMASKLP